MSNANFGKVVVTTRYDDDVRKGWFKRPYEWEYTVTVQQQVGSGTSVDVGYFRRSNYNFTVSDNLAVTPADFNPYCITAPPDSRLPGGGGFPVCGLYDVDPSKFGQFDNLIRFNPDQKRRYDGVDMSLSTRLKSFYVYGGVSVGRVLAENCAVIDNPQQLQFCKTSTGWVPIGSVAGSYTLPWWDISTAATFQSNPGPQITAAYPVPNALIAPSLGRDLSAGARATAPVALVEPGTLYGDRWNELDFRLTRTFRLAGARQFQVMADLYNLFNANPVVTLNTTYGPNWQRPQTILPARFLKIGAQLKF